MRVFGITRILAENPFETHRVAGQAGRKSGEGVKRFGAKGLSSFPRVQDFEGRVSGAGIRVHDLRFRVEEFGFRVPGSNFSHNPELLGFGFRVSGLRFLRVQGFGVRFSLILFGFL